MHPESDRDKHREMVVTNFRVFCIVFFRSGIAEIRHDRSVMQSVIQSVIQSATQLVTIRDVIRQRDL